MAELKQNISYDGEMYGPDHKPAPPAVLKAIGPDHPALKDADSDESEAAEAAPPVSSER